MARPLALIFGESPNDTRAIRHLINALLPEGKAPECRAIREPGTLSRGAAALKRHNLAKAIAIVAARESTQRDVGVVVHEDCDDVEDAHIARQHTIRSELAKAGVQKSIAAAPAWELESWWMLFPEALSNVCSCWAPVDYSKRAVGQIRNSKEVLRRDLRPKVTSKKKGRCPDYAESDSERIAIAISTMKLAKDTTRIGRSASLSAFKDDLLAIFCN